MEIKFEITPTRVFVILVIWLFLWVEFGYQKPTPTLHNRKLDLNLNKMVHPVPVQIQASTEKVGVGDSGSTTVSATDCNNMLMLRNKTKPMIDLHSQYPRQFCSCDVKNERVDVNLNQQKSNGNGSIVSTCSQEASDLGPGQQVISYSFYTNNQIESNYFYVGIEPGLKEAKILYPGWVSRIYTNVSVKYPSICPLICKYPNLFWCDITHVPELGNLSNLDERSWRFLPLGDPTVDIFISRDIEAQLTFRERVAVSEWERSNFSLHSMRDHPFHAIGMLGGMWGAKNSLLGPKLSQCLQSKIITGARIKQQKNWDQIILNKNVYKPYRHLVLAHDSYLCEMYHDATKTLPFSVQRFRGELIGARNLAPTLSICPEQCRPDFGKNWEYC